MNLCSSGISSLRSRSPRGSELDTRSTTPDFDGGFCELDGRTLDSTPEVLRQQQQANSYTAFASPDTLDRDSMGNLIDNHTLLPAYKKDRTLRNYSQNRVSEFSEPDPSANEYPPDYGSVTSVANPPAEDPGVVSAEVHGNPSAPPISAKNSLAGNESLILLEHKPLFLAQSPPTVVHEVLKKECPPVAPLASAEDLNNAAVPSTSEQPPLATSSPHNSEDDIEVPAVITANETEEQDSFRNHEEVNFSRDSDSSNCQVNRRHTIPLRNPTKLLAHNSSLPPPLESDL